jgi:AraC-like DNA-binding protein
MNWYYIIIGAAAFQGLLLSIGIQQVRRNKKSLNWLSALLASISVCLVGRIFYDKTLFPFYPKIAVASDLMIFTYGPFVYWYIKSIFFNTSNKSDRPWKHFVIAGFHAIWIAQYLLVADAEIFRLLALKLHQDVGRLTEILGWMHISIYLAAAFKMFTKYPLKAKAVLSNLPTLHFLQYFFVLNIIVLMMWATGFFLLRLNGNPSSIILTYNSIWILLTCSVYMIGYYAIVFPQVFRIGIIETIIAEKENGPKTQTLFFYHTKETTSHSNIETVIEETATAISQSVTVESIASKKETTVTVKEKLAANDAQVLEFAKKLEYFMDTEKPFLDPNLTLPMLSAKLCCTVHLLSKIINEQFGKNFFDYINGYRVSYFINLAQKPTSDQYTILSLAFESGFNSKSTFNHSFKKITDKTPSQYLKVLSQKDREI